MTDVCDHPEYLALVAGIRAVPDDDLPRLVAADWLEERGEDERAAYVRHHVRGDPLPLGMLDASPDLEWLPVLARHTRRGLADRVEYLNGDGVSVVAVFDRGFIDRVSGPLAALHGGECRRCAADQCTPTVPQQLPCRRFRHDHGRHPWCEACRSKDACPACNGTGRTPGVLAELLRREPVSADGIEVTDREPDVYGSPPRRFFRWVNGDRGDAMGGYGRFTLPQQVYDEIECDHRGFPTADAARLALSRALHRIHAPQEVTT